MKRGTPDHWKMKDLARRCKVPAAYALPWANGVMERIWHYAEKYCLQGDIGRVPNVEIAEVCCWPVKRADELITALVESKWLDFSKKHRLLIHDWPEHCTDSVKKTLRNRGLEFFFPENSGNVPENSGNFLAALPSLTSPSHNLPSPRREPEPENQKNEIPVRELMPALQAGFKRPVTVMPPPEPEDEEFRRVFEQCWLAHEKIRETRQMTEQILYARFRDGNLDIALMESRHGPFAAEWRRRGWQYATVTLLGWVDAGMPKATPQAPRLSRLEEMAERLKHGGNSEHRIS